MKVLGTWAREWIKVVTLKEKKGKGMVRTFLGAAGGGGSAET